jgi:signal transduction histidine kinase
LSRFLYACKQEEEKMQQPPDSFGELHRREPSEALFPAELLATVGHEFRGPLTTIQGYATTLLHHAQQLSPEERLDFLRAINEASIHLGKLVDRFLELAQFESNVHPFTPASLDLEALAQEAITAAKKTRPHPLMIRLPRTKIPPSGEPAQEKIQSDELTVFGDRRLLRTMLDVLLENAIAYSSPEGLIEVSIKPVDPAHSVAALNAELASDNQLALILPATFQEEEPLLEIQVQDHGIGIPPEHLSHIFHRFYRVDTRLTRDVNGLGLGLTLCKSIVVQHRGMLWVESTVGEGSTFHILLPRGGTPNDASAK